MEEAGVQWVGRIEGRWVCKTIGLHWFNLGLIFGWFQGDLGLHWFTCGRLWFVWLRSCLCGFYFCPGMRRGMEEMWAVIWAVWLSFGLCGCAVGLADIPFICGGFGVLCGLFWRCDGGCFVGCGECGEEGGDGVVSGGVFVFFGRFGGACFGLFGWGVRFFVFLC